MHKVDLANKELIRIPKASFGALNLSCQTELLLNLSQNRGVSYAIYR